MVYETYARDIYITQHTRLRKLNKMLVIAIFSITRHARFREYTIIYYCELHNITPYLYGKNNTSTVQVQYKWLKNIQTEIHIEINMITVI